ncbi:F-box protein CPR1-like [Bidens hawaiensis]|uniref:F-box protein CPR1-like n=1 Tax=Bidens hawaiensis TaxID=980011 RepID=UPI00404B87A9
MAEAVNEDVVEQILIALDANDLIRYKSVCKAWYSLITSPRFVKRHLNHSYNKDYSNNKLGHRRVSLSIDSDSFNLVGSSNGLVCMKYFRNKLIVGNPLTRELRQLAYPTYISESSRCWGFGYDSSSDDYKVILGVLTSVNRRTSFWLLSLTSNAWRDIGVENYGLFDSRVGVLYNGALHWIACDHHNNRLIVSFDLSKEEFKEIHLPNDTIYYRKLGIIKECLCVFGRGAWWMKKYNVKEQWEFVKFLHEDEMNYDIVHTLRLKLQNNDKVLLDSSASKYHLRDYVSTPVFV